MIVKKILNDMEDELKNRTVKDVRMGLSYTGVLFENNDMGISYTFREEITDCCEVMEEAGDLEYKSAWELGNLALEPNAIDSSVGMATINATVNQNINKTGDILEYLDIKDGDSIGMVGNFKPLIERFNKDIDLHIFERNPDDDNIYPDWAVDQFLPNEDIVIISGTTLVNKTIDHLLSISQNAREIVILGPTTTMCTSIFKKRGVTALGGTVIEDPGKALKIISQGGGTRKLNESSKKVDLILE